MLNTSDFCDPLIVSQDAYFLVREHYGHVFQVYHSQNSPPKTGLIQVPVNTIELPLVDGHLGVKYGENYEHLLNFFSDVFCIAAEKKNNTFIMVTLDNNVINFYLDEEMYIEVAPVCFKAS